MLKGQEKTKYANYGLKQLPRTWFGRFAKVMFNMGCKQRQRDHILFIKHSTSGGVTLFLVYVDNIIITGDDNQEKLLLNQCLAKKFKIKVGGKLKYFLGSEVTRSRRRIFIIQQKYITDSLRDINKPACKPASTPIDLRHKLRLVEKDTEVDKRM